MLGVAFVVGGRCKTLCDLPTAREAAERQGHWRAALMLHTHALHVAVARGPTAAAATAQQHRSATYVHFEGAVRCYLRDGTPAYRARVYPFIADEVR